jgi:hypothetical protein
MARLLYSPGSCFSRCGARPDGRENSLTFQHFPSVDALLRSHHELRAAVRLAGQKIAKLNFGRRNDPVLEFLRRTLREARAVARAAQEQSRQN